ncbi:MAG: T9SS type B sorting domain-containing protein, partial [Bacteroidales bacterium]|nr:T9SS type B sorting domain-containing protein [Candidatus Scybalocola fimicaballi]
GESGGFKLPTAQTPDAIVGDAECSDCSIVWYKEDKKSKITEAEATPKYADVKDLEGNKDYHYYVKQVNALGCESEFMPVTIIVSGYPTPIVKNISVCENSDKLKGTIQATAQGVKDGASAEDFTLVWYKSKPDGTMDDSQEFTEINLSPSEQPAATDGSKTKTYKYYVLQRLGTSKNDQSAAVMVTVTVYANPKLTKLVTDPKCKGESQKLSEMYDIDLDGCDATHYDANSGSMVTLPSDVVTDAGLYEVKGWYIINKGTSEEETCSSQEEDLTVVFHELDAEIEGSDRTCPGVSVDMKAVATVGGGLKESELYYDWKNNLNTETGAKSAYKTGADGLDAAGDKMTVTLEVSSDACKGSRAVKKTKVITVGDGPLVGKIAFSEAKNTSKKEEAVSSSNITFNSCGGDVSVELSGIVNKNGGEYTLSGGKSQSGKFSSETSGTASLSLGEGKYTIEYVNECPTKFEFEIIDYSNTATATNGKMTICENEDWSAEILDIKGPKPTIKWIHGTDTIAGESGAKLEFKPAKPEDSGKYSYTLLSAGCKFDGKIALGDELKVKPYAVLDNNSYKKYYEVINGDGQDITIGFKVPADVSEVESDIKWSDPNTGLKETGANLSIKSVETDYNLHVTVENKEYCKAETDIEIKVDARLKIEALIDKLDGSAPSTKIEICEDETAKLVIDTVGTGNVLHPEKLTLKVTETTSDGTRDITLVQNRNTKMLEAEVSPKHDAKYDVTYEYAVGSQSLPQELSINVHEKFQVEWEAVEPVCEGDVSSIVITKVYPDGTDLDWTDNLAEMSVKGSLGGASAEPKHTNEDPARQITTVKVIAKNGLCQDKAYMIPVPVDKPIEGEILSPGKICQYDELSLDASSFEAETYEWTYVEKDSSFSGAKVSLVPEPDYATFVLNMKRGTCSKPVEKTVEVTSAPSVDKVDSLGIRKIEIVMESNVGTEPFRYIIDGNEDDPEILNPIRDGLEYKEHVVKVVDEVGCSTEYLFVVNNPAIEIPFLVSPDGNGINDKFIVKGLAEGYPDAKVTIFDRWGKKLASYRAGDDADWDGVYNGSKMPSTDYWYEIQIKEIKKTYTGHFTLIRQ